MGQSLRKSGPLLIIIAAIIPILLWLPTAVLLNPTSVFRSLGQVLALVGTILFCTNFILAARFKFIEFLFSGLNRVYIVHHLVGVFGFTFLVLHPVFIILSYLLISLESALDLITPSLANIAVMLGSVGLLIMIVLLVLTLYFKLEYDTWKKTHQYLGVPLFFAIAHAYLIGSTLATQPILKAYIFTFFLAGVISYLYRMVLKRSRINKLPYIVDSTEVKQSVTFINLKPVGKQIKFIGGQFVFIEIKNRGIAKQSHPFSITSSPNNPILSLAIKSVGEYTETVKLLEKGSEVLVEGPYGRFSNQFSKNKKQIWIAGGIGITPFIGMLKSFSPDSKYSIVLFNCIREESEKVILDTLLKDWPINNNVQIITWVSSSQGRLTAEMISKLIPDTNERDIYLCGPIPMMSALKQQLKDLNVPANQIYSEEFSLA